MVVCRPLLQSYNNDNNLSIFPSYIISIDFGLNSILWTDELTKKANRKSHRGFKRRDLHKMLELCCGLCQQSASHYRSFSSNKNIWPQRNKVEPVVMIAN